MTESWTLRDQREYAWNYFELHARQRMSVFNYFVIIAALLTAGLAGSLSKDDGYHLISFVLSLSLIVISFVFWKLDQRVRYFIKHAEKALKILEKHWTDEDTNIDGNLALFSAEEESTGELRKQLRNKYRFQPWRWHMSYYKCFCFVYFVFGVIGVLGMIMSIVGFVNCQPS